MPQAEVVGFPVHWEVFTSCAKQKLVFSADRAAARRLPVCQPRPPASCYTSEHQVDCDSGGRHPYITSLR